MNRIRFRKEVAKDLALASAWYEQRHEGLGDDMLEHVRIVVERIGRVPLEFPIVHRDIRRALVRRFPYAVFFRMLPDEVLVIAVTRQAVHPRRWRSRGRG